jgi:hypothetical protein
MAPCLPLLGAVLLLCAAGGRARCRFATVAVTAPGRSARRRGVPACALPTPRVPIRRLLFAPALLFGAAVARAQDGDGGETDWPAATLPVHLASDEPRELAWAAFFVRHKGVRAAIPGVRQALARLSCDNTIESLLARLQLLDALIQLDVRLPGEELLPHAAHGMLRVPALILAARSPEVNAAYFAARMESLDNSPDLEWRVCGNLLAEQRDPRFVRDCLAQLAFAIDITVRNEGVRPPASSGSG